MRIHFNEVASNKRKSVFLMFLFIVILGLLGGLIGLIYGNVYFGLAIAVIISLVYTLIVYYSGDGLILKMTGAKPVTKKDYPYLFHTLEGLSVAAGLPVPKAYVIQDTALNAFATGRDPKHASITITTGLLEKLDRAELEGVIAHEMSHIKNYDVRLMMLAAVLVGAITLMSDFLLRSFIFGGTKKDNRDNSGAVLIVVGLVLAILAPLIAEMIKLAVSRKREYAADANAAVLTRHPKGLAEALKKIAGDPDPLVDKANKATAHLFISTPFRKTKGFVTNLFSTHPPIEERIKRLEQM